MIVLNLGIFIICLIICFIVGIIVGKHKKNK